MTCFLCSKPDDVVTYEVILQYWTESGETPAGEIRVWLCEECREHYSQPEPRRAIGVKFFRVPS